MGGNSDYCRSVLLNCILGGGGDSSFCGTSSGGGRIFGVVET